MLTKKTPRRKCTDHEREWRGFCVDKNLQDDWLERLNSLEAFSPISICEGHCNGRAKPTQTPPHVKLRLKERFLSDIAIYWNEQKMVIVSKVWPHFPSFAEAPMKAMDSGWKNLPRRRASTGAVNALFRAGFRGMTNASTAVIPPDGATISGLISISAISGKSITS